MGFSNFNSNSETNQTLITAEITVTDSVEVVARVGASNLENREFIRIFNNGPGKLLVGPSGSPKEVVYRNTGITINLGPDVDIYMIAESGASPVALVWEGA